MSELLLDRIISRSVFLDVATDRDDQPVLRGQVFLEALALIMEPTRLLSAAASRPLKPMYSSADFTGPSFLRASIRGCGVWGCASGRTYAG